MNVETAMELILLRRLVDESAEAIIECCEADVCIIFVMKNDGTGVCRFAGGDLLSDLIKEEISKRWAELGSFIAEECHRVHKSLKDNQC